MLLAVCSGRRPARFPGRPGNDPASAVRQGGGVPGRVVPPPPVPARCVQLRGPRPKRPAHAGWNSPFTLYRSWKTVEGLWFDRRVVRDGRRGGHVGRVDMDVGASHFVGADAVPRPSPAAPPPPVGACGRVRTARGLGREEFRRLLVKWPSVHMAEAEMPFGEVPPYLYGVRPRDPRQDGSVGVVGAPGRLPCFPSTGGSSDRSCIWRIGRRCVAGRRWRGHVFRAAGGSAVRTRQEA